MSINPNFETAYCGNCFHYKAGGYCKAKNIKTNCLKEGCIMYLTDWKKIREQQKL